MEVPPDTVVLWTWDDGWTAVRPTTAKSFLTLYGRLRRDADYRPMNGDNKELSSSSSGLASNLFLVRQMPVAPGAMWRDLRREWAVAGQLCFSVDKSTNKLSLKFFPGRYQVLVLETLRHVYDILLGLDGVVQHVFTDRDENLLLPMFGTESGSGHLERFVKDVAEQTAASFSSIDQVSWRGWENSGVVPLPTAEVRDRTKETRKIFEFKTVNKVCPSFRERHHSWKYSFWVDVPAGRGNWRAVGDEALDMRPYIPEDFPYDEYWSQSHWPNPVPVDAPRLPFSASPSGMWKEGPSVSTSLTEALVGAGIIARTPEDVRKVARRRSIQGRMHPGFEVPLLLGEIPDLLVAPMSKLEELVEDYGVLS